MKQGLILLAMLALATPAQAQLGGLIRGAQKGLDTKQKIDDLTFSEEEERKIGEDVSIKVRDRYGVVQDRAVHKYVTLVGTALTGLTERAKLPWVFVVLDTDGVNAFATPGGFVHITKGALALLDSEAELAAVLGHEIGHVVQKHTINAIRKSSAVKLGSDAAGSRSALLGTVSNLAYNNIIENAYDRGDENDADNQAVQLAQKAGYRGNSLGDFLNRLAERNKAVKSRNGLFASHPEIKERIGRINKLASSSKTTAIGQTRFTSTITYEPTPLSEVAVAVEGSAGLTGGGSEPAEKKEEPKKRGLGLGSLTKNVTQEKQTAQVSASGGARGVGTEDKDAKGGPAKTLVTVQVTPEEVEAFKKGIV